MSRQSILDMSPPRESRDLGVVLSTPGAMIDLRPLLLCQGKCAVWVFPYYLYRPSLQTPQPRPHHYCFTHRCKGDSEAPASHSKSPSSPDWQSRCPKSLACFPNPSGFTHSAHTVCQKLRVFLLICWIPTRSPICFKTLIWFIIRCFSKTPLGSAS